MSKKNVLQLSKIFLFVSTALGACAAQAGPLRYDDGSASNRPQVWEPQNGFVDFGDQLDIGFGFDFFGGTANRVQVNNFGQLELLNGTTSLGSITLADTLANGRAIYGRAAGAVDPLPALIGDPVTNGFRVQWNFANGLQAQVALFSLGSGDSLIELNYLGGEAGIDLSLSPISLGLVTPASGTGFNLRNYLTGNPNQPGCLSTFGRGVLVADPDAPSDGCTSYFVDNTLSSLAIPAPFNTTNGGALGEEAVADYRYLLRYTATTTTPPNPVPEPATLTLLTLGFAALAAARRRRRD
jgi:hypothetical protein